MKKCGEKENSSPCALVLDTSAMQEFPASVFEKINANMESKKSRGVLQSTATNPNVSLLLHCK